jgi:hypothetical protein
MPSQALYSLLIAVSGALFLASSPAMADSPSFTYIEAEYVAAGDFDISDGSLSANVDMDGFALTGSVELGIFLIQASRFELESETLFDSNLEDSISTFALGLTFELPRTSVYGLARARRDELSVNGRLAGFVDEEIDETSVGLEAGVRVNVTNLLELNANIGSPALDEGTSYGVGAKFMLTNNLGLTLRHNVIEVEDDDLIADLQTTSVGLRLSF